MTPIDKRLHVLFFVQIIVAIVAIVFIYGYVIRLPLVEGLIIVGATGTLAGASAGAIAGYISGVVWALRRRG